MPEDSTEVKPRKARSAKRVKAGTVEPCGPCAEEAARLPFDYAALNRKRDLQDDQKHAALMLLAALAAIHLAVQVLGNLRRALST